MSTEYDSSEQQQFARGEHWSQLSSITCPQCGKTSYNTNDARERYCGNCHQYHDTMKGTR